MPDVLRLAPGEALPLAQRLIDEGRPFHAHEVLEAEWKSAPAGQRPVWKGLAQLAVGLTHARRGNAKGAVSLLHRGAAAVGSCQDAAVAGLDPAVVAAAADDLASRIERDGLDAIAPAALLLVIRTAPPTDPEATLS